MTPFSLESTAGAVRLRLAGEVTIEHAAALHGALVAELACGRTLELDSAAATRIDAAIVQLLLAAARAAHHPVEIHGSTAWSAACTRFGLTSPFPPAPPPDHRHA